MNTICIYACFSFVLILKWHTHVRCTHLSINLCVCMMLCIYQRCVCMIYMKIHSRIVRNVHHRRLVFTRPGKTTAMRRTAVRERLVSLGNHWRRTCNSGHLLKPIRHHSTMVLRGLRVLNGPFNCANIKPRDASLSDSRCNFFQSGCVPSLRSFVRRVREPQGGWMKQPPSFTSRVFVRTCRQGYRNPFLNLVE